MYKSDETKARENGKKKGAAYVILFSEMPWSGRMPEIYVKNWQDLDKKLKQNRKSQIEKVIDLREKMSEQESLEHAWVMVTSYYAYNHANWFKFCEITGLDPKSVPEKLNSANYKLSVQQARYCNVL